MSMLQTDRQTERRQYHTRADRTACLHAAVRSAKNECKKRRRKSTASPCVLHLPFSLGLSPYLESLPLDVAGRLSSCSTPPPCCFCCCCCRRPRWISQAMRTWAAHHRPGFYKTQNPRQRHRIKINHIADSKIHLFRISAVTTRKRQLKLDWHKTLHSLDFRPVCSWRKCSRIYACHFPSSSRNAIKWKNYYFPKLY